MSGRTTSAVIPPHIGSPTSTLDVVGLFQAELMTSKATSASDRQRAFEAVKAVLVEYHDGAKSSAYAEDLRCLLAAYRSLEKSQPSRLKGVEGLLHTANNAFRLAHDNFGRTICSAGAIAAAVMGTLLANSNLAWPGALFLGVLLCLSLLGALFFQSIRTEFLVAAGVTVYAAATGALFQYVVSTLPPEQKPTIAVQIPGLSNVERNTARAAEILANSEERARQEKAAAAQAKREENLAVLKSQGISGTGSGFYKLTADVGLPGTMVSRMQELGITPPESELLTLLPTVEGQPKQNLMIAISVLAESYPYLRELLPKIRGEAQLLRPENYRLFAKNTELDKQICAKRSYKYYPLEAARILALCGRPGGLPPDEMARMLLSIYTP